MSLVAKGAYNRLSASCARAHKEDHRIISRTTTGSNTMTIIQDIHDTEFRINERITEIDEKIEMISVEWDQAFEKWTLQMISSEELRQLDEMFRNQLSVLEKERKVLSTEKNSLKRSSTEDADSFEDWQEPAINIESDDEMHQFIESVETEILVDD
jgi:hypothetical protein